MFTLIHVRGNSIGTDGPNRTRPDRTHFKSLLSIDALIKRGYGGKNGAKETNSIHSETHFTAGRRIQTTYSQRSSSNFLAEKKRFLNKKFYATRREPLKSYQIILSKLNAITCLTITSKWSVAIMEIFLSLKKCPALCKLKSLGAS